MNASNPTYDFLKEIRIALVTGVTLLLLLCGLYPLLVWGISQALFPWQASGSIIESQGAPIGSALLGQVFTAAKYFHSRPSNAGGGYDATSSGGSNLGQTSKTLMDSIQARGTHYRLENGLAADAIIPADAVNSSASGLDPEISLENALLQISRVAKERKMEASQVERLLRDQYHGPSFGFLGEGGVNVLKLNLELDKQR